MEFVNQYKEAAEFNKEQKEKRTCELLSTLYQRYKGKTIEVKPEKIKKAKDELYLEFCQKHDYDKDAAEAKKKFNELFIKVNNLNYVIHPSAIYTSRLLDFKNLPEPRNSKEINEKFYNTKQIVQLFQNPAKQQEALELEIEKLEKEIKQTFTEEQKELVKEFVQVKKKLIDDEENEELMNYIKKMKQEMKEKGFSRENIEKIISYCERLVKSVHQLEEELQVQVEVPPKK